MRRAMARLRGMRKIGLVALFLAGLLAGGAIVYGLHRQHWLGDDPDPRPAAFSEVDEPRAGELAERFRPWLRFDEGEPWRPLNVARLLAERRGGAPAHRFCRRAPAAPGCDPLDGEADFRRRADRASTLGRATFLDLAGGRRADYRGPTRCGDLLDCGAGPGSAIYYHVTHSNDRFYVDYWWFLRFNHFSRSFPAATCRSRAARQNGICGEHEGDWEGVTVVTPPGDDSRLDYVVYAAHKGTFRYAAGELTRHDGTRPEVYVARGSHGAYPRRCPSGCDQPIAIEGLLTLPESPFDGEDEWERNGDDCRANAPGSCLLSLPRTDRDPQAWTVWAGHWGAGCGDACGGEPGSESPPSPGLQPRYQTPWCSTQAGAFTCDGVALGCSDWLGPLVAAVACDPEVLSRGLREPEEDGAGGLSLTVEGEERTRATTPGVVQALGDPLGPGDTVTVRGAGSGAQVLVRARQERFVVEARFDRLDLRSGPAVVTVGAGAEGPTVLANGRRPVERRVLEVQLPVATSG